MKKLAIVLVLCGGIAFSAFAQLSAGVLVLANSLVFSGGQPAIEVAYDTEKFALGADLILFPRIYTVEEEYDHPAGYTNKSEDYNYDQFYKNMGVSVFFAPKAASAGRLTILLPVYGTFKYQLYDMDKDALPAVNMTGSFIYKEQSFTISLDIGGRLDFALTEHVAFLVDLRVNAVSYTKGTKWCRYSAPYYSPPNDRYEYETTTSYLDFFRSYLWGLGIKYVF